MTNLYAYQNDQIIDWPLETPLLTPVFIHENDRTVCVEIPEPRFAAIRNWIATEPLPAERAAVREFLRFGSAA